VTPYLLTAVLSYLSGSIPFGYLLVRIFRGEDIRKTGSGNIGATNVSRKSPALGVLTLLLDALKGFAPVMMALWWAQHSGHSTATLAATAEQVEAAHNLARPYMHHTYLLASMAAFLAIVGHVFPIWLHFRGGKGVATGLGSWIGLAPRGVLVMVVVFILVVAVFRYISLGSITAAAVFPLAARILHDYHDTAGMLWFMAASSLLIISKHHANIQRLLRGTETRLGAGHS
jgi:acyl phosphate:glycerol-3-phosphate acyltransferase